MSPSSPPTKRCFVSNRGIHDYSLLARFGTTIFVTDGRVNLSDINSIGSEWARALRDSSPDDYIVPSGPLLLNMIGASLFASLHGRLNLLLFKGDPAQPGSGHYVPREIPMASLMGAM